MIAFSPKADSGPYHSAATRRVKPSIRRGNDRMQSNTFRDIPTRLRHSPDVLSEPNRRGTTMTDDTSGPKPWDIEQFRGVRRHAKRKEDWEKDRELVLDASYRSERLMNVRRVLNVQEPSFNIAAPGSLSLTYCTNK